MIRIALVALLVLAALAGHAVSKDPQAMPYDNAKLLELARYLVPDDPSLVADVSLAFERPRDYVSRFAESLNLRGIDEPIRELPWIALVDGLIARDRLREIDWKESVQDVIWNLDQLAALKPARPDRWTSVEGAHLEKAIPEQTLPAIARRLREDGLALVTLDIDSDSYPLMVLAPDRVAEAQRLAKAAGYGKIDAWGAET